MTQLSIDILGQPRICINDICVNSKLSQKAVGILVYLLLSRETMVSRELLAS